MKEEWKYAFLASGKLSVITAGVKVRHKWYASNWDILIKVNMLVASRLLVV